MSVSRESHMSRSGISLHDKLEKIRAVFDVDVIASLSMNRESVLEYYRKNRVPYTILQFHTDLIHVGISRDGIFRRDDLLEGVRVVEKYIRTLNAGTVLELATGRGANSLFLARLFPRVNFYGIDLSHVQLQYANSKAKKVNNFSPSQGDYHDLIAYAPTSLDIVFVLESLCYSNQKERVLAEVHRILKPGGVFVVIDGYLCRALAGANPEVQLAFHLMEKGVAVERFELYQQVKIKAQKAGFIIEQEEDVTEFVLPFMRRYERFAEKFFAYPRIARLINAILPRAFTYNAMSGYLFPEMLELGLFQYMITVYIK